MNLVYYNEHDQKAAAWLRELIKHGHIPDGVVDTRSISEVHPNDLAPYIQHHFFAGIGGWSEALRLAKWPSSRPVWTGSCPCQPYSSAGKGLGDADPRNLWPDFFRLIRECRPDTVFGEQVESAIRHGWFDGISADLEGEDYAVGSAVLGAHSVGAPHIRQRLYWMAYNKSQRWQGVEPQCKAGECERARAGSGGATGGLVLTNGTRRDAGQPATTTARHRDSAESASGNGRLGNAKSGGCGECGNEAQQGNSRHALGASWSRFELIPCRDGKARRIESSLEPLVDGVSGRVAVVRPAFSLVAEGEEKTRWVNRIAALRDTGNAIVPQVAAQFIVAAFGP